MGASGIDEFPHSCDEIRFRVGRHRDGHVSQVHPETDDFDCRPKYLLVSLVRKPYLVPQSQQHSWLQGKVIIVWFVADEHMIVLIAEHVVHIVQNVSNPHMLMAIQMISPMNVQHIRGEDQFPNTM